jgi:hypothetical protein
MTPAIHASLVSLTLAKTCFTGVIDIEEVGDLYCPVSMTPVMHDVTGVNDTGNACFNSVIDAGEAPK